MRIDTGLLSGDLSRVAKLAHDAEAGGYDGLWTAEAGHDPFLACALAATATEHVSIGTNIAVAFPRSPLVHAQIAWDLQAASRGRFILGLGTQVKGHNERRFSVPWRGANVSGAQLGAAGCCCRSRSAARLQARRLFR